MSNKGLVLALFAGSMAALASVSAKLATSYDETLRICNSLLKIPMLENVIGDQPEEEIKSATEKLVLVVRILGVAGIVVFNGLMWTLFTKSLQLCSSSVEATVTNTAANFIVTAVVSHLLFNEHLPILWWAGSCFILIGLLLIHRGAQKSQLQQEKKTS